jgi:hypothetical protein
MKFYIDTELKCHIDNPDGAFREFHDPFFDSKCQTVVEGYRYKPEGENWTREDGAVFSGAKMIAPWKDYSELDAAQREYERQQIAEYEKALAEIEAALGV